MAKPTSSSTRKRRTASKRPTSSKTRATRSKASNAKVTRTGGPDRSGTAGRPKVTRGSSAARTGTGSAKVTSGSRPALPPGKKGGQLATRKGPRRTNTNRATSSGRTQMGIRGSAKPQLRLPARATPANAASMKIVGGLLGRISLLLQAGLITKDIADGMRKGYGVANIPNLMRQFNELGKKNAKAAIKSSQSSGKRTGGPNRSGKPVTSSKPSTKTKPSSKSGPKEGEAKIVNNKRLVYRKGKWVNEGRPRTQAPPKSTNKNKGKEKSPPKSDPKPNPKPPKKQTTRVEKSSKSSRPNPRMSGEGAPGAQRSAKPSSRLKVRGGNNAKGRTKRLEDALKSVKKYRSK